MNQMYDVWHVTLRGLLKRAVRDGGLRPELESDAVAALIIATLTSMTLPMMTDPRRGDRALRQLELWLGVAGRRLGNFTKPLACHPAAPSPRPPRPSGPPP